MNMSQKMNVTLGELLTIAKPQCPACHEVIEKASIVLLCPKCFWGGHATECKEWVKNE